MARSLAQKHKLPFTRPADYFAEMVKSDAHMERIRQRLLDESATIKRSEEKRKEMSELMSPESSTSGTHPVDSEPL